MKLITVSIYVPSGDYCIACSQLVEKGKEYTYCDIFKEPLTGDGKFIKKCEKCSLSAEVIIEEDK